MNTTDTRTADTATYHIEFSRDGRSHDLGADRRAILALADTGRAVLTAAWESEVSTDHKIDDAAHLIRELDDIAAAPDIDGDGRDSVGRYGCTISVADDDDGPDWNKCPECRAEIGFTDHADYQTFCKSCGWDDLDGIPHPVHKQRDKECGSAVDDDDDDETEGDRPVDAGGYARWTDRAFAANYNALLDRAGAGWVLTDDASRLGRNQRIRRYLARRAAARRRGRGGGWGGGGDAECVDV